MTSDVFVSVPADGSYLSLVRAVVGHASVPHDLSVEQIYGLRIAASEACAILLTAVPRARSLSLRLMPGDTWEITASVDADHIEWPPDAIAELPWAISLLAAFSDEFALERAPDGCPAVRFRRRVA
jgi:hypothetical protein